MERASIWQGRRLKAVIVLTIAFAAAPAWSAEAAWKLERDRDGIQIHSRAVEGWAYREFRGTTRVNARLPSIVAVLDDINVNQELVDVVSGSSIHDRESATRYRTYSTMDMPFPLSDRDILNQREITQDPKTLVVTITDVATKGVLPHKKGLVRIEQSRQQWVLTPTQDGGVNAELRILSDPAGPMPASLVNAMSVDTPFDMLTRLKQIVKRDKYAQAKLVFISEEVAKPKPMAVEPAKEVPAAPASAPLPANSGSESTDITAKPVKAEQPAPSPEAPDKPCNKDKQKVGDT